MMSILRRPLRDVLRDTATVGEALRLFGTVFFFGVFVGKFLL
jgi:hypothetical protein